MFQLLLPCEAASCSCTHTQAQLMYVNQGSQPHRHHTFTPCNDPLADTVDKTTSKWVSLHRGEGYVGVREGTAIPGVVIMEERGVLSGEV